MLHSTDLLGGVWAAVPTPFDSRGAFDPGVLRENVARLCHAGVDGVYSTDADGEFYALEFDDFVSLVSTLGAIGHELGIATQAGVTWSNTEGTVQRLRAAADAGVLGAHVGHPMFMPMSNHSLAAFWGTIANAVPPEFRLVHYNSGRLPNQLSADQYRSVLEHCPNLVGTKHVGDSVQEFLSLIAQVPQLAHLTSEHSFTPFSMFGAAGVCSWFTSFNAPWMVAWSRECRVGDWARAAERQRRMHRFITLKLEMLGRDNLHAVMNKGVAAASDFLLPSGGTRAPYQPIEPARIAAFRAQVMEELHDMVWVP